MHTTFDIYLTEWLPAVSSALMLALAEVSLLTVESFWHTVASRHQTTLLVGLKEYFLGDSMIDNQDG